MMNPRGFLPRPSRAFAVVLAVTVMVCLGIGGALYSGISRSLSSQIDNARRLLLDQLIGSVESTIVHLGDTFSQFLTDPMLVEFADYQTGSTPDSLEGESAVEREIREYKYTLVKNALQSKLSRLKLSLGFIESLYFFDSTNQTVMIDNMLPMSFENFYDTDWLDTYESLSADRNIVILGARNKMEYSGSTKRVITIVYRANYVDKRYLLVVNLDPSDFYQTLLANYTGPEKSSDVFVSDAGRILLSRDVADLGTPIDRLTGSADSARTTTYQQSSAKLGWTFTYFSYGRDAEETLRTIAFNIVVIMTALMILIVTLFVMTRRYLYRPIVKMSRDLSMTLSDPVGDEIPRDRSDIEYISSTLRRTMETYSNLKTQVSESVPIYRQLFFLTLMSREGVDADRPDEWYASQMRILDIPDLMHDLTYILLHFTFEDILCGNGDPNPVDAMLFLTERMNTLNQKLCSLYPMHAAITSQNEISLLIRCSHAQREYLVQQLRNPMFGISESSQTIPCKVIVSRHFERIQELPEIVARVKSKMDAELLLGDIRFIDMEAFPASKSEVERAYPKDIEGEILTALRTGNPREAVEAFDRFVGAFRNYGSSGMIQIQLAVLRLLNAAMEVVDEHGADIADRYERMAEFMDQLGRSDKNGFQILRGLLSDIAASIEGTVLQQSNRNTARIIEIVHRRFREDLALTEVAEECGLSPSYVSRLMKERTGRSFKEYLTSFRIAESKRLLISTEQSVMDIGKNMGYNNSNYFIKVFHDVEGLTPGEYRKAHRKLD